MMTFGCGLNAVQLPFSAHFDPKLPEMFLSEGTTLRSPAKMHPPTYHLASLDPIEVYFNPKRLPLKADTHFPHFATFCEISPQSTFGYIQQLRRFVFFLWWVFFFLLECFYLFEYLSAPIWRAARFKVGHHTTSSHCSVRNTIFIMFARSDFFISYVFYDCDFHMRKPIVEKFYNI